MLRYINLAWQQTVLIVAGRLVPSQQWKPYILSLMYVAVPVSPKVQLTY